MTSVSTLLSAFKIKIEEAVTLVPTMMAEEKLKAVQFWNVVSEKLQEIVNNSAADISALAFEMEKQQDAATKQNLQEQTTGNEAVLQDTIRTEEEIVEDTLIENEAHLAANQHGAVLSDDGPPPPNSARIPYRMDLTASVEAQATAEENVEEITSQANGIVTSMDSDPCPPSNSDPNLSSYSLPPSTHSPRINSYPVSSSSSSSSSLLLSPSSAPLMMAPTMITAVQDDQTVLNDVPRTSRLQELLSRPLLVGSNKTNSTPKNKQKSFFPGSASNKSTDKSESSTLNARKQSLKNIRRSKNFTSEDLDEGVTETTADSNKSNLGDDDTVMKNIKVETEDDVTDEDGESRSKFKENGSNALRNTDGVLVAPKGSKTDDIKSAVDVDDDEEEGDEEDDDEDDDDNDNDGCFGGDVEEVEEIGLDPVTDQDGKRVYTCTYCQKMYANASAYKAHKYSHTKPYGCVECHARFTTKGNLIVHERRHTGEKPYGCPQCKSKFSTKGNLKRHIRSHSGERPWQCSQCGGRFTEKKSLTVHMRRHTGERPYQCTICGKQFAQTGILQTHMSMHMDQREHLCEHCGKSFRQKSQLRLHMLRHQGVRKYNCDQCEAKFLTKGDLERHNRVHTGERPFVCELCGKTFTRQQSLNEHMNRHYGLKPYQCKYCGKGFAEMSACYKHIKHHERAAKQNTTRVANAPTPKRASVSNEHLLSNTPSVSAPSGSQLALVDETSTQKFAVLVRSEDALDVGSEIAVVQHEQETAADEPQITVAVNENLGDFTAINLLANASTTFQQNF